MRTRRGSTWDALAVLKLFDEVNRTNDIDGNTKAQKLTFLLELLGQKAGIRSGHLRFSRYKYGPYSWELPSCSTSLRMVGSLRALPASSPLAGDTFLSTRCRKSPMAQLPMLCPSQNESHAITVTAPAKT